MLEGNKCSQQLKILPLKQKNSKPKFFSHERFFIFCDQSVVKTQRSQVLAVQIKEKEKSLKEKAPAESFYSEDEVFSFLYQSNIMTSTKTLIFQASKKNWVDFLDSRHSQGNSGSLRVPWVLRALQDFLASLRAIQGSLGSLIG